MCRPTIIPDIDDYGNVIRQPYIVIKEMYHPSLLMKFEKAKRKRMQERLEKSKGTHVINHRSPDDNKKCHFIPNTTEIGSEIEPNRAILLTGPNMGGKSTLLR